ncbi:MAG: hypothetical protein H6875_00830 [Hyphomicrobiaceae bacterium]|nr:hypothetical protein [Hyphomicrobiaceae bacterium]
MRRLPGQRADGRIIVPRNVARPRALQQGMKMFAAQLYAQSHGRISPASIAVLADPARCRRTGPDGATDTATACPARAMTLCTYWMAGGLVAKAAGMDMGMMDRRRPMSAPRVSD